MPRAFVLAFFAALTILVSVRPAFATPTASAVGSWQEAHQTNGDVRITVGADGVALFRHRIRLRIVAGHFKLVDLLGLDPRGEVASDVRVLPEKGGEIAGHAEPSPKVPGATRVTFDEPKGLTRGLYTIDVTYRLDLIATNVLTRDGALVRLAWTSPASPEGVDGARVVFDLPSAPTPPRLASAEDAPTTMVDVDRGTERDEVELLRARIPRGEAVTWALRVDPKAFPAVRGEVLAPPAIAKLVSDDQERTAAALGAAAVAGLALVFVLLGLAKRLGLAVRRAPLVPLLPLPGAVVPFAHAASAVAGYALLSFGRWYAGSAFVLLAVLLGTYRAAPRRATARGPGRWKEVADADVFLPAREAVRAADPLDVGTRAGKLALVLLVLVAATATLFLAGHVPLAHVAFPLTVLALVPLFVTGTRAQEPKGAVALAADGLAPARDALARLVDLTHVELAPIARAKEGNAEIDEVRLACAPVVRIPGLRNIELALAPPCPGPFVAAPAVPEVLVRYEDGSAAGAKVASIARGMPVVVGRGPDEKVLRVSPRVPSPEGAARLVARLLQELEGRRAGDLAKPSDAAPKPAAPARKSPKKTPRYRGPERRGIGFRRPLAEAIGSSRGTAPTVL